MEYSKLKDYITVLDIASLYGDNYSARPQIRGHVEFRQSSHNNLFYQLSWNQYNPVEHQDPLSIYYACLQD